MRFFFRPPKFTRRRWRSYPLTKSGTTHALTANSISSATSVGAPAITQNHALTATGVSSASSVGQPALAQKNALNATGISSATSVGAPAIHQLHALSATGISSATHVGAPTLAQNGEMIANNLIAATSVGHPALMQAHVLTAAGITALTSVGHPALTATGGVTLRGRPLRRYRRRASQYYRQPEPEVGPTSPPAQVYQLVPLLPLDIARPGGLSEALNREMARLDVLRARADRTAAQANSELRRVQMQRLSQRLAALQKEAEIEAREAEREIDEEDEEVIIMHLAQEMKDAAQHQFRAIMMMLED